MAILPEIGGRGGEAAPVYSVAIVGVIWLPIPFQAIDARLPEGELSVWSGQQSPSGAAQSSRPDGIRGILTPRYLGHEGPPRPAVARHRPRRDPPRSPTIACSAKSQRRMPSPRISISPANSRAGRTTSCALYHLKMDAIVADQHRRAVFARRGPQELGRTRDAIFPILTARGSAPHDRPPAPRKHAELALAALDHGAGNRTTKRAPATEGSLSARVGTGTVLRPDPSAMRFDDLLRNRQPEAGVLSKALMRPVGVEALEDALQRVVANPGPVVIDDDFDF